jgi:hypothetical protein
MVKLIDFNIEVWLDYASAHQELINIWDGHFLLTLLLHASSHYIHEIVNLSQDISCSFILYDKHWQ